MVFVPLLFFATAYSFFCHFRTGQDSSIIHPILTLNGIEYLICRSGSLKTVFRLWPDFFYTCVNRHINLLKPTGYVMHHQFNIQQLYALPTLYLYVLYLSENKQRLVSLTA